jgi:hypothetical protein
MQRFTLAMITGFYVGIVSFMFGFILGKFL